MIGYKGFTEDLKCRDFQFAENETFEIKEPIQICRSGFHFCDVPLNVLDYYKGSKNKYAIIEALGEIQFQDDKLVTNKIRIVKIISKQELLDLCGNNKFITNTGLYQFQNNVLHSIDDRPARIYIDGNQIWYTNGKINRANDKPAIIHNNGNQYWYINDELHRENDKPAAIYNNNKYVWYKNGYLHRDNDLPAIISNDGEDWYKNGLLHRDNDKPARICITGTRKWCKYGQLHRENNKPAIIHIDNSKEWYTNGIRNVQNY